MSFCYEEWTPYAYTENGKPTSEIIEQLTSDLQRQSIKSEFYEYPYTRCILEVNKGKVDFALFVDQYEDIKLINSPIANWQLAVVSTSKVETKQDFLEKTGSRVIISNDYAYPDELTLLLGRLNKQVLPTSFFTTNEQETKALFNLLIENHAESMVADKVWTQLIIKKHNLPLFVSEWTLTSLPQYIGYSKFTQQNKLDLVRSTLATWPKID